MYGGQHIESVNHDSAPKMNHLSEISKQYEENIGECQIIRHKCLENEFASFL